MEKCSVCGKEFETEEALLKHTNEDHADVEGAEEQAEPDSKRDGGS